MRWFPRYNPSTKKLRSLARYKETITWSINIGSFFWMTFGGPTHTSHLYMTMMHCICLGFNILAFFPYGIFLLGFLRLGFYPKWDISKLQVNWFMRCHLYFICIAHGICPHLLFQSEDRKIVVSKEGRFD